MLTVTVRHHMSAGHRLLGLGGEAGKCENLHGHTFGIEWTFRASDASAREVEFGAVKKVLRGWVDEKLDHGYIVGCDDVQLMDVLVGMGVKYYPLEDMPTTEAIAVEIARVTAKLLPALHLLSVTVSEGPHNAAAWTRD